MSDQKQSIAVTLAVVLVFVLASCRESGGAIGSPTGAPTLTVEPPVELDGSEWLLNSLNGNPPVEGSSVSLKFFPDNYLQGAAGCNSYGADYATSERAFDLQEIHKTSFDCDVPANVAEQERGYFEALEKIAAYRATAERLEFDDAGGQTILVFARKRLPAVDPELEGTDWTLSLLHGEAPVVGSHISLKLGREGFDGFTGCNRFGGEYKVANEGVLFTDSVWQTEMECESQALTEQEQSYVEALRNSASYRVTDDLLEINSTEGETTLTFVRNERLAMNPDDLLDTAWKLASLDGQPLIEGSTITLAFHNGYRAGGHAGCRDYIALYEANSSDLRFNFFAMMKAGCSEDEDLMIQGDEYTTLLGWASGYGLVEDRLEIITSRGEVLVFESLAEDVAVGLEGTAWVLSAFVEEADVEGWAAPVPWLMEPLPETRITATFENGIAGGSAGCNSYGAPFAVGEASLQLETPEVTAEGCLDPPGIMEQEQRYLDFLANVASYHIYQDQLWLEIGDGQALIFVARDCSVPNAFPLKDAELVWPTLHQVQPDQAAPGEQVEIRGTGGFLYWNNECGEFRNESAKDFQLFFDGDAVGFITCYAHTCLVELMLPADVGPGTHTISVEGGSELAVVVGGEPLLRSE